MSLADFTQLDAVNLILKAVGQTAVQSLGSGANALAVQAETTLDEVNREIQALGWWFNTEREVEYSATTDNEILLGSDIFHVDSHDASDNFVKRGNRLYDLTDHTFTFLSGTSVSLDIIRCLDWLELPLLFRQYVAKEAASRLVQDYLNDAGLVRAKMAEAQKTWERLVSDDSKQSDYNLLSGNRQRWASLNYGGRGAIERGLI